MNKKIINAMKIVIIISIILIIISTIIIINNKTDIPNKPTYIDHKRSETFLNDALNAIATVRAFKEENKENYSLEEINNLIEKKLINSPYNANYKKSSCIKIENNSTNINLENLKPFVFEYKDFMQEELSQINNIISILSTRIFSQALISAILKSTFVYQYMQADILNVLQKNFAKELAEDFIEKTKNSIKEIISLLQSEKLI